MRYWSVIIEKGSPFGGPNYIEGTFIVGSTLEHCPDLKSFTADLAGRDKGGLSFRPRTPVLFQPLMEIPRVDKAEFHGEDFEVWRTTDGTQGDVGISEVEGEV